MQLEKASRCCEKVLLLSAPIAMMPSFDIEQVARIIAENVASAFERMCDDGGFEENERETVVQGLMRELLTVLPTSSSETLAYACNRHLSVLAECGMHGPRVESVDPDDGAVTMRMEWGHR